MCQIQITQTHQHEAEAVSDHSPVQIFLSEAYAHQLEVGEDFCFYHGEGKLALLLLEIIP